MLRFQPRKVNVRWAVAVIEIVPYSYKHCMLSDQMVIAKGASTGRNERSDLNSSAQAQTNKELLK